MTDRAVPVAPRKGASRKHASLGKRARSRARKVSLSRGMAKSKSGKVQQSRSASMGRKRTPSAPQVRRMRGIVPFGPQSPM